MERRTKQKGAKRSRRTTVLITLAVVAVVIALLVMEQVAVLYVLATLGIVGLLIIVAWSDLGQSRQTAGDAPPRDDAAAIADGLAAPASGFGANAPRQRVPKRG